MIYRNSKPAAAIVPAELADLLPVVQAVLSELGESLQISRDEEILSAYERARAELEHGDVTWYDV